MVFSQPLQVRSRASSHVQLTGGDYPECWICLSLVRATLIPLHPRSNVVTENGQSTDYHCTGTVQ
jgi:hypothetical protein